MKYNYFNKFTFLLLFVYSVASLSGGVQYCSVEYSSINHIGDLCDFLLFSVVPMASLKRLSKAERQQITLPENLKEILVGLLLADLYACKQAVNVHLQFGQGIIHKDYLYHLYKLFQTYCLNAPKIQNNLPDRRTGKVYSVLKFQTRAFPCFNELYHLFYPSGKKIVPLNIAELLTPLALAYWLSDDGSFIKSHGTIILSTDGFSLEEVKLLASVLNNKWDFNCTINKSGDGFRIRIPKKSVPKVQALLKNIMPPMMLHKIGL